MHSTWRRSVIAWLLLVLAILALYWDTGAAMVSIWHRSETFAHAFLVPPISLWLAWRQRQRLAMLVPRPAPWVLLPMALAGFAWLLGELVAVNAVTQFALVALLVLSVPAVLGLDLARALLFPLSFLFFAVPVGEFMLPTLMQWTADFTVAAVRLSGVPVYREGLQFVIPSGSWSVVEACSGVRYLIASFMVGSLFAYLNYRSAKRRWIFVGVSLLVPILANWLRAYMIVMLGHLSDNKIATGVDHLVYGWVFFGVVIMLLFTIGARWSEPDAPVAAATVGGSRAAPTGASPALSGGLIPALALLIAAGPLIALRTIGDPVDDGRAVSVSLPVTTAGGWRADAAMPANWAPAFKNPTATASQAFSGPAGQVVGVHVLYYRQQRDERKLVSSINSTVRVEDPMWNAVTTSTRAAASVDANGAVAVRETLALGVESPGRAARQRLRIWQLYWVNGAWTASDVQAKLIGARDRLRGRGDDGAAVIVFAREEQPGAAEQALAAFMATGLEAIESSLVAARDGAAALR